MPAAVASPPGSENGADPLADHHPVALYDQIAQLVGDVPAEIHRLFAERDKVSAQFQKRIDAIVEERRTALEAMDVRIKELNGLLKAMGREPIQPAPKRSRSAGESSHGERPGLSTAKQALILRVILDTTEPFATAEVHEKCGNAWHDSSTHTYIAYLRNHEYIGRKGKDRREGARGRILYRIIDRDRLTQLLDEVSAQAEA